MAKIYTGLSDEKTIELIASKGLETPGLPKWVALRLALALSLKISDHPDPEWEKISDRSEGGSEYQYEQLTGKGQEDDYTDVFCALLSAFHEEDLFSEPDRFRKYLQRHIRRGLHEIRTSWKEGHDFHAFLAQDMFGDPPPQPVTEKQDISGELEAVLLEIGVNGKIQTELDGVRLSRYLIRLENLQDLERLEKNLEKLAFSMGNEQGSLALTRTHESRVIGLDIPRGKEFWQKTDTMCPKIKLEKSEYRLPVSPGVQVMGEPFIFDLAETPHLLIGGTTGSGKSVIVQALILSLLKTQSSKSLKFCLIDAKRVEFNDYNQLGSFLFQPVITEPSDALTVLKQLRKEMASREQRFADQKVRNIDEYLASGGKEVPRIVVIIDELADLVLSHADIETELVILAQKARSSGIHLILATQRPDAKTFTGLLRSNIPSRIALTVQKASESKIILDETGAENLTGYGDMVIKLSGRKTVRVHGYHVQKSDIERTINEARGK